MPSACAHNYVYKCLKPQIKIEAQAFENAHDEAVQRNTHSQQETYIYTNLCTNRNDNFQLIVEISKKETFTF